jgi:hypothetical protein
MLQIKDNLLAKVKKGFYFQNIFIFILKENANVLCVDWSAGSSGIYYPTQASSVVTCGIN